MILKIRLQDGLVILEDLLIKAKIPFRRTLTSMMLNFYYKPQAKKAVKQLPLIRKSKWDVLIILDACRFDYFSQEYKDSLDGDLTKVWSPASNTFNWLKLVFPAFHNLTYVSANPGINSVGIPVYGYNAIKHFKRIIDVWDFGWDDKLGTIPPWNVNEATLKNLDDRMVIHYMQPHGPYIGATRLPLPDFLSQATPHNTHQLQADAFIARQVKSGKISIEQYQKAYRDNLTFTLGYVRKILDKLPHRHIIITSDHGELLGEFGMFLHPVSVCAPILRQVPWLEIQT